MLIDEETARLSRENNIRIKEFTHYPYELIHVDNVSEKKYVGILRDNCDTYIRNNYNAGNPRAWDQGVAVSTADIIILMDNDCQPTVQNWDKHMVDRLMEDNVGITFPHSVRKGDGLDAYKGRRDGFCFAFKKSTYERAGKFLNDQPFKLGYFEDDYFQYRVQFELGMKLVACDKSRVWHRGRATSSKIENEEFKEGVKLNEQWFRNKSGNHVPYLNDK